LIEKKTCRVTKFQRETGHTGNATEAFTISNTKCKKRPFRDLEE
jgi:hypothetical protein